MSESSRHSGSETEEGQDNKFSKLNIEGADIGTPYKKESKAKKGKRSVMFSVGQKDVSITIKT